MNVFERLAPFIQDYIYRNEWEELRANQVAACEVIFDTDDNLLLSSGTASGKTEAAFLPVLTELYEHPSASVGVLYISPLGNIPNPPGSFSAHNDKAGHECAEAFRLKCTFPPGKASASG